VSVLLSSLKSVIYDVCFVVYEISDVPLGAPLPGFIYATGQEFKSVLVEYVLEPSFFISKSSSSPCTCHLP
jgi:hypothetical protein